MRGKQLAGATDQKLRVLLTYKGSAPAGSEIQDDYISLNLEADGRPEPTAAAVVNFPVMEGEKALFIHSLDAGDNKAREYLLGVIEDFARKRGYPAVYIHTGKQKKHFLKKNGFEGISEKPIARKVLEL